MQLSDISSSRLEVVKDRAFVLMSQQELEGMEPAIERTLSELKDHSSHSVLTQRKVDPSFVEDEVASLKSLIGELFARVEFLEKERTIRHDLTTILKSVEVLSDKMGNIVFSESKINLKDIERNLSEGKDLLISHKDHLTEIEGRWNQICQEEDGSLDESVIQSSLDQIHSR